MASQSRELIERVVFQIVRFLYVFWSQVAVGTVQVVSLIVSATVVACVVFPVQAQVDQDATTVGKSPTPLGQR